MTARAKRRAVICLAALAAAAVAAAGAPSAEAAFPGANGRIAFAASGFDSAALPATMRRSIDSALPSGGDRRTVRGCEQATGQPDRGDCAIEYRSPAWSPRGSRIAFDAGLRLALMHGDGSGFRLLERRTADDGEPAWSPGGTRLVFSGVRTPGGRSDLYVLDVRNGRLRRLTFKGGRSPDWSSRGRIAFVRGSRPNQSGYRPGAGDIYTVRADGHGLRRITYHRGGDPSWSPHASKLAFVRQQRFDGFHLYTVRTDGRHLHRLSTPGADSPEQPAWAPDGRRIAYDSFDSGVWAQRLDGSGTRQVAAGGVSGESGFDAFAPAWQPLPKR
jgi:TolB protein